MSKCAAISLLFIFPFLFLACGAAKQTKMDPALKRQFSGLALAKDIDRSGAAFAPVEPTKRFSSADDQAVALVGFENLSGNHWLKWDWRAPDGSIYYSTGDYPIRISTGKYVRKAQAWHKISIQGDRAQDLLGDWVLEVWLDSEMLAREKFTLKPQADIDVIPISTREPYPNDWGVVIGIEEYENLPKVEFARRDAESMKDHLVNIFGVPEDNIVALIDSQATKAMIESRIKQHLPKNLGPETTLYVYYAGHGYPGTGDGGPSIVPYDVDVTMIEEMGYKLKNLISDLNNLPVRRVFLFVDSCFSGYVSRGSDLIIKTGRPIFSRSDEIKLDSDKVIVFRAATESQVSNGYPKQAHGLFTYFLIKAFRGEADANNDEWVTVKEAFNYVVKNVSSISQRIATDQTPTLMPTSDVLKDFGFVRTLR